jgi:hypothetical protein
MIEDQLRALPPFDTLPIYNESDTRADAITTGSGYQLRECTTLREVQECLADPTLTPLGALRVSSGSGAAVVAYFGARR